MTQRDEYSKIHIPKTSESSQNTNDIQIPDPLFFRESFNGQQGDKYSTDIIKNENYASANKKNIFDLFEESPRKEGSYQFNLEKDARKMLLESNEYTEADRRRFLGVIGSKTRRISEIDRKESIRKYIEKKNRRKYVCQIKYKVRQDLATKRLRVKGKFVKSSKMDLMAMANRLLIGVIIRRSGILQASSGTRVKNYKCNSYCANDKTLYPVLNENYSVIFK